MYEQCTAHSQTYLLNLLKSKSEINIKFLSKETNQLN